MLDIWRCDVCREERSDASIKVHTVIFTYDNGAAISRNIKYCSDDPHCFEKALIMGQEFIEWINNA